MRKVKIIDNGYRDLVPEIIKIIREVSKSELIITPPGGSVKRYVYTQAPLIITLERLYSGPPVYSGIRPKSEHILEIGKMTPDQIRKFYCNAEQGLYSNRLGRFVTGNNIIKLFVEDIRSKAREHKASFSKLLKIVLLHEFSHYLTIAEATSINDGPSGRHDRFLYEGVANLMLYHMLDTEGKQLLADLSIDQDIPYRTYQIFKLFTPESIFPTLDALLLDKDPWKAIGEFYRMIGGRIRPRGETLYIYGDIKGLMVDWDGEGGTLISPKTIDIVGPWNSGYIISPRINQLASRYSSEVKILTNHVKVFHEYNPDNLPENIVVNKKTNIAKRVSEIFDSGQPPDTNSLFEDLRN